MTSAAMGVIPVIAIVISRFLPVALIMVVMTIASVGLLMAV